MQPFVDRRSAISATERPARKALETCLQELQKVQCRFRSVAEPPARHHSTTNRLIGRYRGLKEAS